MLRRNMASEPYGHLNVALRNGYGQLGEKIELLTNLYRLKMKQFEVRKYRVEIKNIRSKGNRNSEKPVTDRFMKREIFWRLVRRHFDVFKSCENMVFDDYEFAWALDPIRPPQNGIAKNYDYIISCDDPEKPNSRFQLLIYPLLDFDVVLTGEYADESAMFLKNLITQRSRFPPEVQDPQNPSPEDDRHLEFYNKFTHFNGAVYRIPMTMNYPQQTYVCPGVRAWMGLYASLRVMENYHPVVNFGFVNKLFIEMEMNIFDFWADVCQEIYSSTSSLEPGELFKMSMNKANRNKMADRLEGIKLKTSMACIWDEKNRKYFLGERHYKFKALADQQSAPQTSMRSEQSRYRDRKPKQGRREYEMELHCRKFGPTAQTFMLDIGDDGVSMAEFYYRNECPLRMPHMPLCVVQAGKTVNYVPMEVLLTHDSPQVYRKILDFDMKMKYIKSVSRNAKVHKKLTNSMVNKMEMNVDPFLKEYDIAIDTSNVECIGRVMDAPLVRQGVDNEEGQSDILQPHSYYRGFKLGPFLQKPPMPVDFLVIMAETEEYSEPSVDSGSVRQFCYHLFDVLRERHVNLEREEPYSYVNWYRNSIPLATFIVYLQEDYADFMRNQPAGPSTELCILVITARRYNFYAEIKQVLDVELKIPNQIIDANTVKHAVRGKNSIYYNLSMKINAKLGGVTHSLSAEHVIPGLPLAQSGLAFMSKENITMFIGIDVTHPSPSSGLEGISIGSVVGSVNLEASNYHHFLIAQMKAKETILNFDSQKLKSMILTFYENTRTFPKHVVIFRDGVSNGELMNTTCKELGWIKKTWESFTYERENMELPTFTYIIVQKRHLVRLYKKNESDFGDPDKEKDMYNVPSGTIVDSGIVSPEVYDFYLASQHGAIGTTRPARYIVMFDEWQLGADQMQQMCYYLCFLYARCAHPVSLPTPLYYAHLACEKAKEYYKASVKNQKLPERFSPRNRPDEEFGEKCLIEKNIQPMNMGLPFI